MPLIRFLAIAFLLLTLVGCGDGLKRVSVQGKITAGGQPLNKAIIQFVPLESTKGEGGIGVSDSEGNFTLTGSRGGAQGVVPGEYKVRVSRTIARDGTVLPPEAKQAENPGSKETLPGVYASVEATPLRATVPPEGGAVEVKIPEGALDRK
jgi:hypothetical protein